MRRVLLFLLLTAALSGLAHAEDAPDGLPDGVEAGASRITACFLPGELDALDADIDASRLPLPGCAEGVIPPRRDIDASRSYLPGNGSVVDCVSMRRRQENSRYLYGFLGDVVAAAEGPAPACAAAMIRAWADADAMTGVAPGAAEGPSRLLGAFVLGGLSSSYLIHPKVRAAAGPDGDAAILGWFGRLSGQVALDIDRRLEDGRSSNILYWEGFAVLPTALMAADPQLMRRSRAAFRTALKETTQNRPDPEDDGFLPAELRRGDKALAYQIFATQPVVGMAALSRAYGCDFLDGPARRDQFVGLVTRSVQGSFEPAIFAEAATRLGAAEAPVAQQRTGTVRRAPDLVYVARRIDPGLGDRIDARLAEALGRPRPVAAGAPGVDVRLGGGFGALTDQSDALASRPVPQGLRRFCGG